MTLTIYGNTFFNQWTYDDLPVVVQNPDARTLDSFLKNTVPGRPLRELSYIPDHLLFGDRPAGYHIQQLGWHGMNGFLLFLLLHGLGVEIPAALVGALLFLVHPFQAESVANISHRKELLALFFVLSSALLHLKALAASGGRRWLCAAGAVGAYAAALGANETAVALPLALVLMEWLAVPRERWLLLRRPLLLALVFGAAGVLAAWRYQWLFSARQLYTVYSKNNFTATADYLPLFMASLRSFGFYLGKIILPVGLAPEYVFRLSASILQPWAWVGAVLLAGGAALVPLARRAMPLLALGAGWFLAFWLPVSNLVPAGYLVADRYMYLCLPGGAFAAAALITRFPKRGVFGAALAVILAWALLTVVQNGHWRTEHTLWRHAARVNADSTWVRGAASKSYLSTGELDQAREHARAAIALSSYNVEAYLTLARVEERRGDLAEALRNYQLFVALGQVDFPQETARIRAHIPFLKGQLNLQGKP
ncbi:MAG: hypothetical protein ED859_02035 [Desulfuromonadales bacterium]|nr:MAG: hypothetical protein ED859_02035 [Desulfuromonadales bacterium]